MSCPGAGHCAGCAGGGGVPVLAFAVLYGVGWIAEHVVEVAITSAACAALAVVAMVALLRMGDRRDARQAAGPRLLTVRADATPLVTATAMPQVSQGAVPAIEQHVHYHYHATGDRIPARVVTGEVLP